jgi:hypothetical protein
MLTVGLLRESLTADSFLDSAPSCPLIWHDEMINATAINIQVRRDETQYFVEFVWVFCLAERPRCSVTPFMVF